MTEEQCSTDGGASLPVDLAFHALVAEPDGIDKPESSEPCLLEEEPSIGWSGHAARQHERFPVHGIRPISMRPLGDDGLPSGPWLLVDILDISLGGLGLLMSGPQSLVEGQALELDLRSHPDFGVLRMQVELRWSISAKNFTTLGVSFASNLPEIPRLELERRTVRRDPNLSKWALDES